MNVKNNRLVRYIQGSYAEMKKVAWPTRKETVKITTIVVIISISVAAFLGTLDYFFSLGVKELIQMKKVESAAEYQMPVEVNPNAEESVEFDMDIPGTGEGTAEEAGSETN